MYKKGIYEALESAIEGLTENEKVLIFNYYCENTNRTEDYIYYMDEMDSYLRKQDDIVDTIRNLNDFDFNDKYVSYDGYDHPYSYNWADDNNGWDIDEIIDFIIDDENCLFNDGIASVLDEYEEDPDAEEDY